ncbi:MAG TPA: helix-turn-helix domain-containing protein [Candidatus Limnocylindrales bacterium]|nr:helix-turn-helix domain-containing protein [Candidatus Limnocylindrales bacterium]
MSSSHEAIKTYFAKLGLEPEIADLYSALHAQGPQTISELARSSGVERTRIYRLLDHLMDSGLVEVETHYKRGVIKAAPISNLRILISKREQELQSLQDELQLIEQVLGRNSLSSPASRVQFYQGPEGIKQMFWNETRATTEVLGILYENMQVKTQSRFFERWVETCNDKDIHFRGIVGTTFTASQEAWYGTSGEVRLKHWQARHISPEIFPITHSTITYNDVVAQYIWKDGEVFGIETYNKDIAATQRKMFELLWKQATSE